MGAMAADVTMDMPRHVDWDNEGSIEGLEEADNVHIKAEFVMTKSGIAISR